MGNYRFRLSDMLPNAWFYKLRDMSKTKIKITTTNNNNHHKKPPYASYYSSSTTTPPPQNHHFSHPKNYHTPKSTHFHDPPRKSSKRFTPNRKTIYKPSPKHTSLTESTHTLQDFFHSPTTIQSPSSESTHSPLTSCTCRLSSSTSDIIIDVTEPKRIDFSPENDLKLPPIITKPSKVIPRNQQALVSSKKVKEKESSNHPPARKSVSGLKLRSNSPKLAILNKRNVQNNNNKCSQRKSNMNESFAVVKSSFDPQKDFKESMMEMIKENNIRASKDFEELLACYLSLNSDEYHDVIVKAFEQIWFSLPDL
ncbi:transcription repressor OFP1-like [Bidens hawaiensis]|uniref:transcription repressor OFP1-like n=1 Tax=Bidens hawaiensis TaxID=980011 RepID=UPI00404B76E5